MRYAYLFVRVGLLTLVIGYIGSLGLTLFQDYQALREDQAREKHSRVVGYVGITPTPCFAAHPDDWFRREGQICWLWSGWNPDTGHGWFRLEPDSINPSQLSGFLGRDAIRAVDEAIFETKGGPHWSRIPEEASVYSLEADPAGTAYPHLVLEKVGIVNATIDDQPLLIVFTPWVSPTQAAQAFDPQLESGPRLRMGSTGYFLENRPLLYDRETESLWVVENRGLQALAGPHRGHLLPLSTHLQHCSWSTWKSDHPEGQVLVGADRSVERARKARIAPEDLVRKD